MSQHINSNEQMPQSGYTWEVSHLEKMPPKTGKPQHPALRKLPLKLFPLLNTNTSYIVKIKGVWRGRPDAQLSQRKQSAEGFSVNLISSDLNVNANKSTSIEIEQVDVTNSSAIITANLKILIGSKQKLFNLVVGDQLVMSDICAVRGALPIIEAVWRDAMLQNQGLASYDLKFSPALERERNHNTKLWQDIIKTTVRWSNKNKSKLAQSIRSSELGQSIINSFKRPDAINSFSKPIFRTPRPRSSISPSCTTSTQALSNPRETTNGEPVPVLFSAPPPPILFTYSPTPPTSVAPNLLPSEASYHFAPSDNPSNPLAKEGEPDTSNIRDSIQLSSAAPARTSIEDEGYLGVDEMQAFLATASVVTPPLQPPIEETHPSNPWSATSTQPAPATAVIPTGQPPNPTTAISNTTPPTPNISTSFAPFSVLKQSSLKPRTLTSMLGKFSSNPRTLSSMLGKFSVNPSTFKPPATNKHQGPLDTVQTHSQPSVMNLSQDAYTQNARSNVQSRFVSLTQQLYKLNVTINAQQHIPASQIAYSPSHEFYIGSSSPQGNKRKRPPLPTTTNPQKRQRTTTTFSRQPPIAETSNLLRDDSFYITDAEMQELFQLISSQPSQLSTGEEQLSNPRRAFGT